MDDYLIKVIFLRHQESVQNSQGYGAADTNLTPEGRVGTEKLIQCLKHIGIGSINGILTGTKKRHIQTLQGTTSQIDYKGPIISDPRLDAFFGGHLMEQPSEIIEKEYGLSRFQTGSDGLYHDNSLGNIVSFDPAGLGIFPFDTLYSAAYTNKILRKIVIPNAPVTPFENIEKKVRSLQNDIIKRANGKPKIYIAISSCSSSGFNLEYSAFDTIGYNMQTRFGRQQKPIFPLDHDELMILGYTKEDQKKHREKLRPVEGNIKIDDYLKS